MPISKTTPQTADKSIRMIGGRPWPIRVNNQGSVGGFALDPQRILLKGSLDVVILGWRTALGLLPPRTTFGSFIDALKEMDKEPLKLNPQKQLELFCAKNIVPYAWITYVPLPSALEQVPPELAFYWQPGVVTGSFFRSQGLMSTNQSLFGDMGLLPVLEAASKNVVDMITTIAFTPRTGANNYFVNEFIPWEPAAEDTEATQLVSEAKGFLKKWMKDHPAETEFPFPADAMMLDLSAEALLAKGQAYRDAARQFVMFQAAAVFDEAELATIDVEKIVDICLSDNQMLAGGEVSPQLAGVAVDVTTIDIQAIA